MTAHDRRRSRADRRGRPDRRSRSSVYLVSTIVALLADHRRAWTRRSPRRRDHREDRAGRTRSSTTINANLDAGVDALEGLLVKKAGMVGRDRPGRRALPRAPPPPASATSRTAARRRRRGSPRSTRGHAHARAARPRGADRRRQPGRPGAAQRRGRRRRGDGSCTPSVRHTRPEELPRSPVIGTDAPVQYEPSDDIGSPRGAGRHPGRGRHRRSLYTRSTPRREERDADTGTV